MAKAIDYLDKMTPYGSHQDAQFFIDKVARPELSEDAYGNDYEKAVGLLAAHYIELQKRGKKFQDVPGAPSGGIGSVTDGNAQISGASAGKKDHEERDLSATQWGSAVQRLKTQTKAGPFLV
ncbi:MAG: DUF4054 domain-containing protein [Bradymonadaceae bacterium]